MFRVIHPNRYFIWTLVFLLAARLVLMFWIQSYLLEVDRGVFEQQNYLRSSFRTYRSQNLGLSVRYPAAWQIEIDPLEADTFALLNPADFGENIAFSRTDPKYEHLIRNSLKIASEKNVTVDGISGTWLLGSDSKDQATSNVILIKRGPDLYYIAGQASQFERIIKSIKFLPPPSPPYQGGDGGGV